MIDADLPVDGPVREFWEHLIADMEATAREYEGEGWETLSLHPGDVTPLGNDADRTGIDVLVPDDEFEDLVALIDSSATFDAYEVYSTVRDGVVFLVVVMRDPRRETAVLFPVYHRPGQPAFEELRGNAAETGTLETHIRRLREDRIVAFTHDEPELFFPDR